MLLMNLEVRVAPFWGVVGGQEKRGDEEKALAAPSNNEA